jgi:CheY-like chemotaxis protein
VPVAPRPGRRIVVADDNIDAAQTMGMLLGAEGHDVHLAHSRGDALESIRALKPDVAILDIGMPDIDGYEVAKRIRHEAWGKNILLITLTGWALAEE